MPRLSVTVQGPQDIAFSIADMVSERTGYSVKTQEDGSHLVLDVHAEHKEHVQKQLKDLGIEAVICED